MKMKRYIGLIAAVMLITAGWAQGGVTKVEAVDTIDGSSVFTPTGGQWNKGQLVMSFEYASATIHLDGTGGVSSSIPFSRCFASATYDLYEDLTPTTAGNAMGFFKGVDWSVRVEEFVVTPNPHYIPVAELSGTVNWYEETEEIANEGFANGRGIVVVDSANFFGPLNGAIWGDGPLGLAGLRSTTTVDGGILVDYSQLYTSEMVTLSIITDWESIPEPMTVALLGIGSVVILYRRKKV